MKSTKSLLIYGIFLFIFSLLLNCKDKSKKNNSIELGDTIKIAQISEPELQLESLVDETIKLKNKKPFGETIELVGEQLTSDTILFKVGSTQMLVKNNILLIRNGHMNGTQNNNFMLFQLPSMKLIRSFGKTGRGPDEYIQPRLLPSTNPDIIGSFIYNSKLFDISMKGDITSNPISLPKDKNSISGEDYSLLDPGLIDKNILYYVNNSPTGKSVYKAELINDSITTTEIQNLALNPKRKGWANYIGDFAIDPKKDRMVYAYKYFKIIKFFDTKNNTVRTINFEQEEFDESTNYKVDGLDQNITHYWGICAQDKYVYMLYSGRTPYQVGSEWGKGKTYIYMEKYDWNGTPIALYKFNRWGYFTVDEKNNEIYLASTTDDDPIFRYTIKSN